MRAACFVVAFVVSLLMVMPSATALATITFERCSVASDDRWVDCQGSVPLEHKLLPASLPFGLTTAKECGSWSPAEPTSFRPPVRDCWIEARALLADAIVPVPNADALLDGRT